MAFSMIVDESMNKFSSRLNALVYGTVTRSREMKYLEENR